MARCLIISSFIALSILLNSLDVFSNAQVINSCSAWMRCSSVPDNTYGLIGKTCQIYRNPCLLALENCDRKARNETLIIPSTKEECKPFCPNVCMTLYNPICGEYMNKKVTFNNQCEMKRYNCKNENSFLLYSNGPCTK